MVTSMMKRVFALALVGAATAAAAQPTWDSTQMLGLNANVQADWNKSWIYRNIAVNSRAWCPVTPPEQMWCDQTPGTLTLKSNGYPAAGQSVNIVIASALTNDNVGTYAISVAGNNPPISTSHGVLSAVAYDSVNNRTTATLTISQSLELQNIALRFNNVSADFGDLKVMQPGFSIGDTKMFTPAAIAHYNRASIIRGMDRLRTNDTADVTWSGSYAANKSQALGYQHSLKGVFDQTAAVGAHTWVNVSAKANNNYITQFVNEVGANLKTGKIAVIEFTNEPWNTAFNAYGYLRDAAFTTAKVFTGNEYHTTGRIVSASRDATGVVTVLLDRAHNKVASNQIYQHVDHTEAIVAPKLVTLIAGTAGSTLKFVDPACTNYPNCSMSAVNIPLHTTWINNYIYLDPTHELVAPLTTYGAATPEWLDPQIVKVRYEMTRVRAIYDAVVAAGLTNRVRIVKGIQLSLFDYEMYGLAWAREKWGSLDWLGAMGGGLAPAFYAEPVDHEAMTTTDEVFNQLNLGRQISAANLIMLKNTMMGFGLYTLNGYEAGPHTHLKLNETIAAAVRQAHCCDTRMKTFLTSLYADWINRGGGPLMFFTGGATSTYGGVSYGSDNGNNTWSLREGTLTSSGMSVKDEWFTEQQTASAVAVPVTGVTYGTIQLKNVFKPQFSMGTNNDQIIVRRNMKVNTFTFLITASTTRNYTISLDAGTTGNANTDQVTLGVNGTAVATGYLPSVNVYTTKPGQAVTAVVNLAAGQHVVNVTVPTSASGDVGLYQLRVN